MNDFQAQIYCLLKKFDAFCRNNDIEYFLIYGTMLGAIRHQGFIPWDDDVDLAMDSENFAKLKKLSKEGRLPEGLMFQDTFYTKGCRVPKIRDVNSDVVDVNGANGIFLDIFPFQKYSSKQASIFKFFFRALKFRDRRKGLKNKLYRSLFTLYSLPGYLCFVFVRYIFSNIGETAKGKWMGHTPLTNPEFFIEKEDVYPLRSVKFEDGEFFVPHNYDKILTLMYGDYMTPVDMNNRHYEE